MKHKTNISIFGKTDTGRVRTNNEDAFVAQKLWDENTYLAIAIDGVGGYEGGEIAADIARKTIPEFLLASSNGERVELLKQAVTAANNAIFEAREANLEHGQMSCVLTAAIIDVEQRQISMAHVGDSRLYGFHHGILKKLSHDHSLIGYREEIGDLSEEEAMHHPQRNVIGRDVGSQKHKANDDDFIDAQVFPLMPNTTLLFCSDGLTDMITSAAITSILSQKMKLEEKAEALIKAALEAGGKDNITVVLFEYLSDEPDTKTVEKARVEKTMNAIKEKQVEGDCELAKKLTKRNWLKTLLLALVGLFVGFVIAYTCINNLKSNEIKELNDTIEQQKNTIDDLNTRLSTFETDHYSIELELKLSEAQKNIFSYENRINELKAEIEQLKITKAEPSVIEKELEVQLNQANSTIRELRNEINKLIGELRALKMSL